MESKCDEASRLSNPQEMWGTGGQVKHHHRIQTAKFMCNSRKTNDLILTNKSQGEKRKQDS